MNAKPITLSAEKFVKKALSGECTEHDWWHIERVRNNARLICKSEKADWFVVELAVLLHDVGDYKVIHKDEDDYTIAENFLQKQKIPEEIIEQVMFIIKNMSFSKSLGEKSKSAPIEFQIVQDADRLDALGAIGIARAFAYGGSKGRSLYDPTTQSPELSTTKKYRNNKSSSLDHFDEKLFLLKDLINTKSAKKIAQERHVYTKEFKKQFLLEWKGKR